MTKQKQQQPKEDEQRGRTSSQQGASSPDDDESPEMTQAGEDSSEKLRRGALDTQYGTDSSSKSEQHGNRPQGSSGGAESTGSSTGSDRDTMGSPRNKGK